MILRWRGTIVYAGSLAVIGAATFARYGDLGPLGLADGGSATVSEASSSGPSPGPSPSASGANKRPAGTAKPDDATDTPPDDEAGAPDAPETQDPGTDDAATGGDTAEPEPAEPAEVTVTGAVVTNREGTFQVAVTFSGGTLVDVVTVQAGHDSARSRQINDDALPVLRAEALQAQSADIDTVSGATYTSEGYRESLQSAIDQHG